MSPLEAQVDGVPVPVPSLFSAPYWEGCRNGQLLFQRCGDCGAVPALPSSVCPRCRSGTLGWEASAGTGRLYSWTVVWRPQHPAFAVPYAPAIVELAEGFRIMSAMVGCEPADLEADAPVGVEFHRLTDEITLPFFHLVARA